MSWRERAACRGMDPNDFHPQEGGRRASMRARSVCGRCPVRAECLEDALASECGPRSVRFGIRGGMTAMARFALQRKRADERRTRAEEERAEREWGWARLRRVLAEPAV